MCSSISAPHICSKAIIGASLSEPHTSESDGMSDRLRTITIKHRQTPVATFKKGSTKSSTELGDGTSSRVFLGTWNDTLVVAIKQLKMYVPGLVPSFVKAYEPLFNLSHPNIAQVLGIRSQTGLIVLEYCSKSVNGLTVTALAGLLLQLGDCIPM